MDIDGESEARRDQGALVSACLPLAVNIKVRPIRTRLHTGVFHMTGGMFGSVSHDLNVNASCVETLSPGGIGTFLLSDFVNSLLDTKQSPTH